MGHNQINTTNNQSVKSKNNSDLSKCKGPKREMVAVVTLLDGTTKKIPLSSSELNKEDFEIDGKNILKRATKVVVPEGITEISYYCFEDRSILKEVKLPSTLEEIGPSAFRNSGIEKIEIPDKVTVIDGCFTGCRALTDVKLSSTLKEIGSRTFQDCSSLKEVKLPSTLEEISAYAFRNSGIEKIEIPDKVTVIDGCFTGCRALTDVKLSSTLKEIGGLTFQDCSSLTEVKLPSTLEEISAYAFRNSGIEKIEIPDKVRELGYAFSGCKDLREIVIHENVNLEGCGLVGLKNCVILKKPICSKETRTNPSHQLDEGKKQNNSRSNKQQSQYKSPKRELVAVATTEDGSKINIKLSSSVIGNNDFRDIWGMGIVEVVIPEGVTKIENFCFDHFGSLTHVKLPSTLREIGSGAFRNSGIIGIDIPEGVTKIENFCFEDCKNLTHITLPSTLREIGYSAFRKSGIVGINIPEEVTKIGGFCFEDCENLTHITLPSTLKEIGCGAFKYSSYSWKRCVKEKYLTITIVIPKNVDRVEYCRDFLNRSDLKRREDTKIIWLLEEELMPEAKKEAEKKAREAFVKKMNSPQMVLPKRAREGNIGHAQGDDTVFVNDGVEIVPAGYLSGCKGLRSVYLPRSVKKVSPGAFSNCPDLEEIVITAVSDDMLGNLGLPDASEYAFLPGYLSGIVRYNELG